MSGLRATLLSLIAGLLLTAAGTSTSGAASPAIQTAFQPDDQLLLEVQVGQQQVTDALGSYSTRAGLFLPLGELARLLDLAILVDPPGRKADGWFLSESRRITIQPDQHTALVEGRTIAIEPGSAVFQDDDLYIRSDLLQKLLPLDFKADLSALALILTPRERLPFQDRLDREARRSMLGPRGARDEAPLKLDTPYDLTSPPAFDLNLGLGYANGPEGRTNQWVLRAAGDLAYTQARAYLSSDTQGTPDAIRLELDRQFGGRDGSQPWRVAAGDVFSPSLPLGISGHAGRGLSFSNEPMSLANVFDQVNLRGELPTGYEVELYVNEVLRGSQSNGAQGRYEFLGIPLSYGLNVVRLAFYGPRGERYEEVRRLNVGGGQLAAGQSTLSVGMVDTGTTLFQLRAPLVDPRLFDPAYGKLQFTAALAYGLTSGITTRFSFGQYSPLGDTPRQLAGAGLSTQLQGIAVQLDAAADSASGRAQSLGLAGRLFDVPLLVRHAEYQGGFLDEREPGALDTTHPLARITILRADFSPRLPGTARMLPVSLDYRRNETVDGGIQTFAGARVSLLVSRLLASANLGYVGSRSADGASSDRMAGALDVTTLLAGPWQLRASTSYNLQPDLELVASSVTVDRRLAKGTVLRMGVSQGWTQGGTTAITAGANWRLPLLNLSLNGAYIPQLNQYNASLQISLGTLFDPVRRRYVNGGPDAAVSGALSLEAFVDRNGNGKRDTDEPGVPGIGSQSARGTIQSDESGRLLSTGLADGQKSTVTLRLDGVEDPYLIPPGTHLELAPRAGKTLKLDYPLRQTGEAALRVLMQLSPGNTRGIAALDIELLNAANEVAATARTEFDGAALFDGLPAGTYTARIRPEQAQRLKLRLTEVVQIVIPLQGGFVGTRDTVIELLR